MLIPFARTLVDLYLETRSITEPAGALALAALKRHIADNQLVGAQKKFVAVISGANMNFDRLRFVAERAELGEGREALLCVEIPEKPGRCVVCYRTSQPRLLTHIPSSFFALHDKIHPRATTEFVYRYHDPERAQIFLSFQLETTSRAKEVSDLITALEQLDMKAVDISDDEMAKSHARYMIGGCTQVSNERMFRFGACYTSARTSCRCPNRSCMIEFPERPDALRRFLKGLHSGWNISLFHYRNHGAG